MVMILPTLVTMLAFFALGLAHALLLDWMRERKARAAAEARRVKRQPAVSPRSPRSLSRSSP
jgi:hypothetical protein